jgi:hypothetical protein
MFSRLVSLRHQGKERDYWTVYVSYIIPTVPIKALWNCGRIWSRYSHLRLDYGKSIGWGIPEVMWYLVGYLYGMCIVHENRYEYVVEHLPVIYRTGTVLYLSGVATVSVRWPERLAERSRCHAHTVFSWPSPPSTGSTEWWKMSVTSGKEIPVVVPRSIRTTYNRAWGQGGHQNRQECLKERTLSCEEILTSCQPQQGSLPKWRRILHVDVVFVV